MVPIIKIQRGDSRASDRVVQATFDLHFTESCLSTDGFASLRSICPKEEVDQIRRVLGDILSNRRGLSEGALFDTLSASDDAQGERSIQISDPSNYAPELLKTSYFKNASSIARALLSPDCVLIGDYALLKPAGVGIGTPWHQDEAFRHPDFIHNELSFWLALQDVGEDEGCLFFIPGSHRWGLLEHRSPNNDPRIHALECSDSFSQEHIQSLPLFAGDCTVHNTRVLHRSSNNSSAVDRYAYILTFGLPPKLSAESREVPWLAEKNTARDRIRKSWRLHGGYAVDIYRALLRGEFYRLPRFLRIRRKLGSILTRRSLDSGARR